MKRFTTEFILIFSLGLAALALVAALTLIPRPASPAHSGAGIAPGTIQARMIITPFMPVALAVEVMRAITPTDRPFAGTLHAPQVEAMRAITPTDRPLASAAPTDRLSAASAARRDMVTL